MTGLILTLALILALAVTARAAWRRSRRRTERALVPGGSPETAMDVSSFAEVEADLSERRCKCGGRFANKGESSDVRGNVRLRIVRAECRTCEERERFWYDVSRLFH